MTPERFKKLLFHFAHTLNKEKPRDKLEDGDKVKIKAAVQETLDWLERNQLAEQGIDYSCSSSRARFEELCMDYFVIPWASFNWMAPHLRHEEGRRLSNLRH